jgi:hypothetical protein
MIGGLGVIAISQANQGGLNGGLIILDAIPRDIADMYMNTRYLFIEAFWVAV